MMDRSDGSRCREDVRLGWLWWEDAGIPQMPEIHDRRLSMDTLNVGDIGTLLRAIGK